MAEKLYIKNAGEISYNKKKDLLDWLEAIIFALFIVTILFTFVLQKSEVRGISMEPTLVEGDQLMIYKFFYKPNHGDIVVVINEKINDEALVKRVIGVPGDTIDIDYNEGILYRNGEVVHEPYIKERMAPLITDAPLLELPVTLSSGEYFVMGDNRNNSYDSKYSGVGLLKKEDIFGKALFRFWPKEKISFLK